MLFPNVSFSRRSWLDLLDLTMECDVNTAVLALDPNLGLNTWWVTMTPSSRKKVRVKREGRNKKERAKRREVRACSPMNLIWARRHCLWLPRPAHGSTPPVAMSQWNRDHPTPTPQKTRIWTNCTNRYRELWGSSCSKCPKVPTPVVQVLHPVSLIYRYTGCTPETYTAGV